MGRSVAQLIVKQILVCNAFLKVRAMICCFGLFYDFGGASSALRLSLFALRLFLFVYVAEIQTLMNNRF